MLSIFFYKSQTKKESSLPISVHSQALVLKNLETGKILMEKNKEQQLPIASLTKLITVYLLLESTSDLNEVVTMDSSIIENLRRENASLSGFLAEDQVTLQDLAYGIVLVSGGDAAVVAAEYVAGSENEFVDRMNELAQGLDMDNTIFKNVTGLDAKNQYATVEDLNKFLAVALKNEPFKELLTTTSYQTSPTNYAPEGYYLESTLLKDSENLMLTNGEILGGKTGYTDKAGQCLVSLAEINGVNYLLITVGAKGTPNTEQFNLVDAHTIFDYIAKK